MTIGQNEVINIAFALKQLHDERRIDEFNEMWDDLVRKVIEYHYFRSLEEVDKLVEHYKLTQIM